MLNQPFRNELTNGTNRHQNMMHNTEESKKSLDDAEEFPILAPIKQRKPSRQGIQIRLEIQMQWMLTK